MCIPLVFDRLVARRAFFKAANSTKRISKDFSEKDIHAFLDHEHFSSKAAERFDAKGEFDISTPELKRALTAFSDAFYADNMLSIEKKEEKSRRHLLYCRDIFEDETGRRVRFVSVLGDRNIKARPEDKPIKWGRIHKDLTIEDVRILLNNTGLRMKDGSYIPEHQLFKALEMFKTNSNEMHSHPH